MGASSRGGEEAAADALRQVRRQQWEGKILFWSAFCFIFFGWWGGGSVLIHPYAREILVMTIKYVSLDPYTIPYSYCTPHIVLGRSSAPPSRVSHSIPFTFLYLIIIPFG